MNHKWSMRWFHTAPKSSVVKAANTAISRMTKLLVLATVACSTSASGTTRLNNVQVLAEEIRTRTVEEGKRTIVTPFLQLFLAAVQAGIARNALNDAVAFANVHARPIKHSSATRSVDDPYVELSVGDISARAFCAEAVVLHAADSIDRAWRASAA